MATVTRQFTYKKRIKVSQSDLRLAKAGVKTCTIRLGIIGVEGKHIDLSDGRESFPVRIVSIETGKRFGDLGLEHAKSEGFLSVGELRADLEKYYGKVDDDQQCTVINFEAAVDDLFK